ncbi:MAG: ABC transporter ATP-binding protein [Planctomycetes bacterium]|nr:ABC transporter ATP-binding protein [Planctomycetota bacterium]
MQEIILKTESLSKRFGSLQAVNSLSLEVRQGDIYGFLGLNGAGKTTTIRMLLSLIAPSAGKIWFYDKELKKAHLEIKKTVGALVEIPAFYNYLSGYNNLKTLSKIGGLKFKRSDLETVLDWVGLLKRANDNVRGYSQGMRQRLGIAQALLVQLRTPHSPSGNPLMVILDEPTNGLDPQGIVDIRNLIKRLNKEFKITFMISSHLLSEIELICNRVGIIKQGAMVAQGAIAELVAKAGAANIRIKADLPGKALELAEKMDWVKNASFNDIKNEIHLECPQEKMAELNGLLVTNGVRVSEITSSGKTLEEYFIGLM